MIDGMVDQRVELTFDDLVGMGLDEYAITLTCVSNEVGGELLGNATWLGRPGPRRAEARAGRSRGADMVLSRSVDGFTASTPLESLTDDGLDAILAVGMNGEPLPLEHGFPVRMVVPGLYGYVSATKWLTELKVTTFAADEAYWTPRGYSARGADQVLVAHRHPAHRHSPSPPGRTPIAGVAWAQTVGIDRVEVQHRRRAVAVGDAVDARSTTTRGCSGSSTGTRRPARTTSPCARSTRTATCRSRSARRSRPTGRRVGSGRCCRSAADACPRPPGGLPGQTRMSSAP